MPHIKPKFLPNTRGWETEAGVNIHAMIEYGRIRIFINRQDAEEDAKPRRRYAYPVYEEGKTNGYYAVPD